MDRYRRSGDSHTRFPKENKINVFNGTIRSRSGLPNLKVEQAFELTDATAERSCSGSTIKP